MARVDVVLPAVALVAALLLAGASATGKKGKAEPTAPTRPGDILGALKVSAATAGDFAAKYGDVTTIVRRAGLRLVLPAHIIAAMLRRKAGGPALGYARETRHFVEVYRTAAERDAAIVASYGPFPPAPSRPYDAQAALDLAPKVQQNLRTNLGFYSPELLAAFQMAAGLRDDGGLVDGRYGGRTAGALAYYLSVGAGSDVASIEVVPPLAPPRIVVPYREP